MLRRKFEGRCDRCGERALGSSDLERHFAARERGGIDAPENEIGIGHGGFFAAAPVAHRSRLRAGAVRADGDAPQRVDARDRAAPRADLDHFDDRDAQRQPAAFEKTVHPRHLERARGLRPRLIDQADFRGR